MSGRRRAKRRAKRSRESYLAKTPEARARQLGNLRPGAGAPDGNAFGLVHGARSERLFRDVEAEVRELADALADTAPVRERDGSLPIADAVAVETAARALKRYRHLTAWCDAHGRLDGRGDVKPAAEHELRAERALNDALAALGMTPASRAKLGLNIARAANFDLARHWAEQGDGVDGQATDAS